MSDWTINDQDRELFARELESFVPPEIFDAHAHWYRAEDFAGQSAPQLVQSGPTIAGSAAFDVSIADLIPGRTI